MFLFGTNLILASTINVTPATIGASLTAAADGDILLLDAGTYTSGINFQTGKVITLQGVDKATVIITQSIGLGTSTAVTNCGLLFKDLTINIAASYFMDGTIGDLKIIEFNNVVIQNVNRCLLRTANTTANTIDLIKFNNCTIKNCGSGGYSFLYPKHIVKSLEVTNTTLYNYTLGESFFYPQTTATSNVFTFSFQNNTVYKWGKDDTRALCNTRNLYSTTSNYVFKNNIIAEPGATLLPKIVIATGGNLVAEKNLVVNYGTYSMTSATSSSITDNTLAGLGLSTVGFTDPANGDFSILSTSPVATASTTGGIIGDPRWLKVVSVPANLTVSVAPAAGGTVTPPSTIYNQGDSVTLTATRNFGYQFKEWRNAVTNEVLSIQNPYTFTINSDLQLQAVFNTLTTYTFDVAISGSNLGSVTLTPQPTNGRYEEGTNVNMKANSNRVVDFLKWEDNSTNATRNILMDGNKNFTATFNEIPFIVGWDFKTSSPNSDRPADYYSQLTNLGKFSAVKSDGTTTSWLARPGGSFTPSYPCVQLWTPAAQWATPTAYVASFSTLGHQNVKINSMLSGSYQGRSIMKLEYSLDGINYTQVAQVDLAAVWNSSWADLNVTLPVDANNQAKIYVRWIADTVNSVVLGTNPADVDGTAIANVFVFADALTTIWNGTTWSNGTPDASKEVVVDGAYSTITHGTFTANKLTLNSGSLTINSGTNLTVQNEVINNVGVNGIVVENNANLVQVNNTTNSGNVVVNRNGNALSRLDYTMWSSPVANQNLATFSPLTSQSPSRFYTYDSSTNLYNTVATPTTTSFVAGTGYLIRMPNTAVIAPDTETFAGQFTGVPNNGAIGFTGLTAGLYYAVGNPYPSTISAESFLGANATDGVLYFWRKTNGSGGSAYATYTAGGATSSTPTSATPNVTIQVGQGFIVKPTGTTLNFTNAMRTSNNSNQIFRTKAVEKNRIWLNLTNTAGVFSQALVGYIDGATQGVDVGLDGKYINDSPVALTSDINGEEYTIQVRPAFDASDVVALNFKTDVAGDYIIAIDRTDGLFAAGQDIYLVDSTTGTETNLKTDVYNFTATTGTANARFSLKYQKTLGIDSPNFNENNVAVYKNNETIYVNSGANAISNIKVFDIQGRLIAEQNKVNATSATIKNIKVNQQVLIVKVTSQDNKVVNKKVVN